MAACDLCSASVGANPTRYSSSRFRAAVRAGLRPPDSMMMMGTAFGLSRDAVVKGWVERAMSDSTDWVLCEDCATTAARYASPKPWWQFWK